MSCVILGAGKIARGFIGHLLYLSKIPMYLSIVHQGEQVVEYLYIAMIRKTEITDCAICTTFLQILEHSIVDITAVISLHTAHTYGMQKEVVDIVGTQISERVTEHLDRLLTWPCLGCEVRELGGDEI